MDFDRAAEMARALIQELLSDGLSRGSLININIPSLDDGPPKGVRVVPQSMLPWEDYFERVAGPKNRQAYWLKGDYLNLEPDADSDLHAMMNGYVAITPMQFDLTQRQALKALAERRWPIPAFPDPPLP